MKGPYITMEFSWVYAEKLSAAVKSHVVSETGQVRRIDFWWDLRTLNEHVMQLKGTHGPAMARLTVFQEHAPDVPPRPTIWSFVEFPAPDEQAAVTDGYALVQEHCARLIFLTAIPIRPIGQERLARLDHTEHGWLPHFENNEFKGIDIHRGPPQASEADPNELKIEITSWTAPLRAKLARLSHWNIETCEHRVRFRSWHEQFRYKSFCFHNLTMLSRG